MPEQEIVLKQEPGVKAYNSESPPSIGLKAGAFAEVGTLILTNQRLVYVSKGGASRAAAWALGGALTAGAIEKSVSKAELDDLMQYEGSYYVPLQEITRVETARKMGSAYLRVDNCSHGQKPSRSYILGSGWSKNEDWVNAINSAKTELLSNQNASATGFLPPPPPPPPEHAPPVCPSCGKPLSYIHQYQRWYCYKEKKYL
ncbi:MAG: hypothetical protein NWE94_09570 [Candidatus Bathyarchaeota archaeon]|nr:hypothetical protein [Candidatus Bathyarchaeota archaeon]